MHAKGNIEPRRKVLCGYCTGYMQCYSSIIIYSYPPDLHYGPLAMMSHKHKIKETWIIIVRSIIPAME